MIYQFIAAIYTLFREYVYPFKDATFHPRQRNP